MEDNVTERSLTEKQRNPLMKWIVLLCALLFAVIVLQIAILLRTTRLTATYELRPKPAYSALTATTLNSIKPAKPKIWEEPLLQPDDWPSQMDAAFRDAQRMFEQMDSRFPNAFGSMTARDPFMHFDEGWDLLATTPTMDMREHDKNYIVQINLATMNPSNIEATLSGRMLTISSTANESKGRTSQTSMFETRVQIPGPIGDPQTAQAAITNGILTIIIPKGQDAGNGTQVVRLL